MSFGVPDLKLPQSQIAVAVRYRPDCKSYLGHRWLSLALPVTFQLFANDPSDTPLG